MTMTSPEKRPDAKAEILQRRFNAMTAEWLTHIALGTRLETTEAIEASLEVPFPQLDQRLHAVGEEAKQAGITEAEIISTDRAAVSALVADLERMLSHISLTHHE